MLKEGHESTLIDRIEGSGEFKIMVRGEEVGELKDDILVLNKPLRSDDLRIFGKSDPSKLKMHGLTEAELPEHEGFKRHLEFVR